MAERSQLPHPPPPRRADLPAGLPGAPPDPAAEDGAPALTVLYDGACPLCRREISLYRGLQPLGQAAPLCFADVSDAALPLPPGTTQAQLLARFHVRLRNGELLSGAQAFLALWAALPGWRWLALAGRLPGAAWLMERSYRRFLRWRPLLQRWAARWEPPGPDQQGPACPAPAGSGSRASRSEPLPKRP
jgi:predicted DCC family thiol-disulfide oxidoreductase YuxK